MHNKAALFIFLLLASLSLAEEQQAFGSYSGFPFVGYGIGANGYVNVPWGGPGPVGGPYGAFAGFPPQYGGYPSYSGNVYGAKGNDGTSKGTGKLSQARLQQLKQQVNLPGTGVVNSKQDVLREITQPNQQNGFLELQPQQSSQQIQMNSPTQTSTQRIGSEQNPSLHQSSQPVFESVPINSQPS